MKVCVYTAVYGGYDDLKCWPQQTVDTDFICFTDETRSGPIDGWNMIAATGRLEHPRMQAKFFKILSHRAFPNGRLAWRYHRVNALSRRRARYDILIWIDGSIQIRSPSFVEEFVSQIGASGWAMFRHPDRNCIYDELNASLPIRKYHDQPLERQVAFYRAEGYPAHRGLMACGLIARRASDPRHKLINEAWWQENLRWSYQDQLSLPVVLWRMGGSCETVSMNLWDNPWFDWIPHASEA
jgi:hypothetical protein